jgi:hypothetical protein
MKIYIIPIEKRFRPLHQLLTYPAHNADYGVEQDFYQYLVKHSELLTDSPQEADWHYLPVFWTRWHLNHDYGKNGLEELQQEVVSKMLDSKKTFLICQYDDGPLVDTGEAIQFLASRKGPVGIDIPLLSSPHRFPFFTLKKKYLASFIGRASTHAIRKEMIDALSDRKDVLVADGSYGSRFFVKNTLRSFLSLCPRGYGGSSFRLFESMQLGVVPFLIGDQDTRPFKKFIQWDTVSFYSSTVDGLQSVLDSVKSEQLIAMGQAAKMVYENDLAYQKWCPYVLKELESIQQ